jgi:polyferredoxin
MKLVANREQKWWREQNFKRPAMALLWVNFGLGRTFPISNVSMYIEEEWRGLD